MGLVTQKVSNLLNGVSQRPATQRAASQAVEQVNGLSSLARGVMKRPPTRHIGKLDADASGWDNAFTHIINRDEDERYHVVVADGELFVYDAVTGEEVPVVSPDGFGYLEDATGHGFRAVTVGDTTFIVNRGVKTARGTTTTPDAKNEALVYVRQADFSTLYTITVDEVTVSLRTVDMDTPASRQGISTEAIAGDLVSALRSSALTGFIFTLTGATIHMYRSDGEDFSLAVSDGLSDNGLKAVKGTIQSFEDLPSRGVKDFVAEITGSIDTAKDNYFVKYDDLGQPGVPGVWRECPKPGTIIDFDATTMPHRLALKGEVGFSGRPHVGLSAKAGTISGYLPTATESVWDSYELPSSNSPHRTETHLGGATITATQDAEYFVAFHNMLDIGKMLLHEAVYARLYKNDVLVDEIFYINEAIAVPPPQGDPNNPFQGNLSCRDVEIGDVLKIRMEYESGESPPAGLRASLLIYDAKYYAAGGRTIIVGSATINGGDVSADVYPIGTVFTVTLDGTPFTFTVTSGANQFAINVAAGLAAVIDADAGYSTFAGSLSDRFLVQKANGDLPVASISVALPTAYFYNPKLSLEVDALIGKVLTNMTDGSSGLIVSNTINSITVSSMTGGIDNTIQAGDICGVFVDPDVGTHFVFSQIDWNQRLAGDVDVVTFPSFMGSEISDVFFYQNRIGYLSKENVVFSSSGDLFNLFRYTATDFRPDDAIDIRSAHADVTIFDSAFLWSGGLYVKSDNVWFRVSGEPALTPTTIRLDPVGRYPSSKDPRPVVVGERAYFTRAKSGNTQVFEIMLTNDGETSTAVDITKEIPTYIEGSPVAMVGDGAEGFLALLTDTGTQNLLYIYSWLERENQKVISSWSKWTFPAGTRLLSLDMADGVLGLIRKHADGAFIEQLDLDLTPDAAEKVAYLDRRIASGLTASGWAVAGGFPEYDSGSDTTTWPLPYAIATDGSQGLVAVTNRTTGESYTVTRPTTTSVAVTGEGDLTDALVYIGQPYEFRYVPNTFFLRGDGGLPETAGRLQLEAIILFFKDTTDFTVSVQTTGRAAIAYPYAVDTPTSGDLRVPVLSKNVETTFTITNATPGPCSIAEIDWRGNFTLLRRRM